jgi:hypothetical protein
MHVADAQRQIRSTYRGGLPGQAVSAAVWLASAAAATWGSHPMGIVVLVLGGFFIFPLTMLSLRLAGRPARTPAGNPLNALALQVAFTVPLLLPPALALSSRDGDWFYPAMMIVVGAHYLPFVFLYGMRLFAALGAVLLAGGVTLGMLVPAPFVAGALLTAAALAGFGFAGWRQVVDEERRAPEPGARVLS